MTLRICLLCILARSVVNIFMYNNCLVLYLTLYISMHLTDEVYVTQPLKQYTSISSSFAECGMFSFAGKRVDHNCRNYHDNVIINNHGSTNYNHNDAYHNDNKYHNNDNNHHNNDRRLLQRLLWYVRPF